MPDLVPEAEQVTYRSRRLILLVTVTSLCLVLLSLFGWYALPPGMQALFTTSQVVTLLIILLGLVALMVIIASSNVRAGSSGMRIRNGLAVHHVPWDRVHKFLLRPGDPWGLVLIKPDDRPFEVDLDAEKFQLMGIQAGDGQPAQEAVRTLTAMQRRYGGSPSRPESD